MNSFETQQYPSASQNEEISSETTEYLHDNESVSENIEEYEESLVNALEKDVAVLEYTTDGSVSPETIDEAKGVIARFREKVGKEAQVAVLTASLLAPTYAHGTPPQEIQNTSETIGTSESYERKVHERITELRELLHTDTKETYFLLAGREDSLEEIAKIEGEDYATSVSQTTSEFLQTNVNAQNILINEDTFFKNFVGYFSNNPILRVDMHNHPYKVAQQAFPLSDEDIQMMKDGERPVGVFPPSIGDIGSTMFQPLTNFDSIAYVVEPSGSWKYDIDESNPNVLKMRTFQKSLMQELEIVFYQKLTENPEIQKQIAKENNLELGNSVEYLQENFPDFAKSLISAFEASYVKLKDEMDPEFLEANTHFEPLAEEISKASIAGEDVSELIKDYVNTAAKIGLHIEYLSNDGNYVKPDIQPEEEPEQKESIK
jgi:hypothetical protein